MPNQNQICFADFLCKLFFSIDSYLFSQQDIHVCVNTVKNVLHRRVRLLHAHYTIFIWLNQAIALQLSFVICE